MPSSARPSSQDDNAYPSPRKGWSSGLEALAHTALPDFLLRQRWYPAKDAGRPEIAPKAVLSLAMSGLQAAISIWQVTPPNQVPMLLFVPLAVVPAEMAAVAQVIAAVLPEGDVGLRLVEAFSVDSFVRAWIKMMLRGDGGSADEQLRGVQCVVLEDVGETVTHGLLQYADQRFTVPYGPQERRMVLETAEAIRAERPAGTADRTTMRGAAGRAG